MSTLTTITGWVGANPVLAEGRNGSSYTTIRVATTDRFRNAEQEWVDGPTQWFGVRLFGEFAQNAAASIRRSDPVVVTGRFALETWETDEKSGSNLVLYATAIGHDLARGRSAFTRVVRGNSITSSSDAEMQNPEDSADSVDDSFTAEAARFEVEPVSDAEEATETPRIAVNA